MVFNSKKIQPHGFVTLKGTKNFFFKTDLKMNLYLKVPVLNSISILVYRFLTVF